MVKVEEGWEEEDPEHHRKAAIPEGTGSLSKRKHSCLPLSRDGKDCRLATT